MVEQLSHKEVKARKEYTCDTKEFIEEWLSSGAFRPKMLFSEMRTLVKAREESYKIPKGTIHISQVNKYEGTLYTYRARKDLYQLCCKYDLFPDID